MEEVAGEYGVFHQPAGRLKSADALCQPLSEWRLDSAFRIPELHDCHDHVTYRPDSTRRNRNIGTAKQGHGPSNRARIPRRWQDSIYSWGRGTSGTIVTRTVWGWPLPFLVEHTRDDCVHACTVDDIAAMLDLLPWQHVKSQKGITGIRGIVLRQPTRKEQTHNPVWARLGYGVQVDSVVGPVVFIEAQPLPLTLRRGTSLSPDDQRELDRLVAAADDVERTRRGHVLHFGLEGVRRVQLYHSLPHEIGHWADMYEKVELPARDDDYEAWGKLWDRYFQRPGSEREEYAHRYAERVVGELRKSQALPFERRLDLAQLEADGLRREDFECSPAGR